VPLFGVIPGLTRNPGSFWTPAGVYQAEGRAGVTVDAASCGELTLKEIKKEN